MAITALYSAATGMKAMDTQLDVVANNLANANTTGFKGLRVNFEDLFYEERRQPGALNSLGQRTSSGLFVGLGVRESNTQFDLSEGSLENTGQPLDIAISGQGFFKVRSFDGIGGGEAYSRAGHFFKNNEGNIVLGTSIKMAILRKWDKSNYTVSIIPTDSAWKEETSSLKPKPVARPPPAIPMIPATAASCRVSSNPVTSIPCGNW